MRDLGGICVWAVVTASATAVAGGGHASSRGAFQAPDSTMSGTQRVTSAPPSLSLPSGRGAASWSNFSNGAAGTQGQGQGQNGQNGQNGQQQQQKNMFGLPMSGGGSSSAGNTKYKPNEEFQKMIQEAGANTVKGLSKMASEAVATTASMTDNFLKSINTLTSQKPEAMEGLGQIAGRIGSTAGSGGTGGTFQSLFDETSRLRKTNEDILVQIGARQLQNVPQAQPVPTQPPVPIADRINAALASGRPSFSGNPMNYLPPGFDKGEASALDAVRRPTGL